MSVPDYYKVLGISPTASEKEIRNAYKKAALKTHPDRVASNDPTRPTRTRKFQEVNDAYYTLSDRQRRRDYDEARRFSSSSSSGSSSWFGGSTESARPPPPPQHHDSDQWQDEQFGNVFEEMLREEGLAGEQDQQGGGRIYGIMGGISGAALGFIVGNVPGMLAGAVAGNRLGAVRDAKGKSVYEVFQQLPQGDKAKISQVNSFHMLLALSLRPKRWEMTAIALGMAVIWMIFNSQGKLRKGVTWMGNWLGRRVVARIRV